VLSKHDEPVEVPFIMRALDPEVVDAVWEAFEPLIPRVVDSHPLGCHRPRIPDRVCFRGMLIRLVVGCSWEDTERLLDGAVSDTTLRARRDEWIAAGVFENLEAEALAAYDRIIGLDLSETAVDGSQHKAPCGGEGTGKNPTDRGKLGIKWSLLTDRHGIPISSVLAGANRHDTMLFAPTLHGAQARGLLVDVETLHLDRGYDNGPVRQLCVALGITDLVCAKRRRPGTAKGVAKKVPLGLRWPIERTNSWLSNFGQLRRNTDRQPHHRAAQLAFAIVLLLTAKLIDWRNRWSPDSRPIR
jgi:transposase